MADKVVEQPEVPVEETEKDLKEKKVEEDEVVEAQEKAEEPEQEDNKKNGDAEKETNGKTATNGDSPAAEEDKCCIKRKSTGGEVEEAKTEEAIPEKKAKLDEEVPAEAEANGAEVAA